MPCSYAADVANVAQGLAATNDATANNAETSDLYTAVAIGAVVAILLAVLISVMLAKRRPSQDDLPVRKSHRELAGAPEASGRTGGPVLNNPMYNPSATKNYIDVSPESPESEMATSVSGYAPVSYKSAGSSDYDERSRVADYTAETHYNEPKVQWQLAYLCHFMDWLTLSRVVCFISPRPNPAFGVSTTAQRAEVSALQAFSARTH